MRYEISYSEYHCSDLVSETKAADFHSADDQRMSYVRSSREGILPPLRHRAELCGWSDRAVCVCGMRVQYVCTEYSGGVGQLSSQGTLVRCTESRSEENERNRERDKKKNG